MQSSIDVTKLDVTKPSRIDVKNFKTRKRYYLGNVKIDEEARKYNNRVHNAYFASPSYINQKNQKKLNDKTLYYLSPLASGAAFSRLP
jgi:hypothetical protein